MIRSIFGLAGHLATLRVVFSGLRQDGIKTTSRHQRLPNTLYNQELLRDDF